MSAVIAERPALPPPAAPRQGNARIALGIAISLTLHALALVFLRLPQAKAPLDPRTWLTTVEVRIVPAPPPLPATRPAAEAPAPAARQVPPKARPPRETRLVLRPAQPAPAPAPAPAAPDPFHPAPAFDAEAAKATARRIAGQIDDPPSDAPNAQVNRGGPKLRESRDERLGRRIQSAARPDCKDGLPGGLLGPLLILMDKKDSGCKW